MAIAGTSTAFGPMPVAANAIAPAASTTPPDVRPFAAGIIPDGVKPPPARAPVDPTPSQLVLPPKGSAGTTEAPATDVPPGTLAALSQQFGADLARLPASELRMLRAAYQAFTTPGASAEATGAFLRTLGTALVHDRQRVVNALDASPERELTRLAPVIQRAAGFVRVLDAADHLKNPTSAGFNIMRQELRTREPMNRGLPTLKATDLHDPARWSQFRDRYLMAMGGADRLAALAGEGTPMTSSKGEAQSARAFIGAMDLLLAPGADGKAPLQRALPTDIATAAMTRLTELARDNPGLQAFSPKEIRTMAAALGGDLRQTMTFVNGPRGGLVQDLTYTGPSGKTVDLARPRGARAEYDTMIGGRMVQPNIHTPRDSGLSAYPPAPSTSALAMFRDGVHTTGRGLRVAETKLANDSLGAADLLPLAYQVQEHLAGELKSRLESGQSLTGVMSAAMAMNDQVTAAEAAATLARRAQVGTAIVGGVAGVGLLLAGPAGWGVGATSVLAGAAGAAAVVTGGFGIADYRQRLRAGGIDQAGLVMSNLREHNFAGLVAGLGLDAAGALGGVAVVSAAARAEQAASQLKYAQGLVTAMRAAPGTARTASVTQFLNEQGMAGAGTSALGNFSQLSPERRVAALRLLERFGPEVDGKTMSAILRFGARDTEIAANAGANASGNVDHMYAAYQEMNRAEVLARGSLTERQRSLNAIATIGTDAQGKFGHAMLDIVPVAMPGGGIARTPVEYLRGIRARSADAIFSGAPPSADPWRARFTREVVDEADGMKRMSALSKLVEDAKADPTMAARLAERMDATDVRLRFLPFTEGAYVHNVVDPTRVFRMAVEAGHSPVDASEAAYRATMHGYGNAFVASAYPGMPQFAGLRVPGSTAPLFTPSQLRNLDAVGRASLDFNQRIQPTIQQARLWGISSNPPLIGARQIYIAALRSNNGELPAGMQEWLTQQGASFRNAKADAGVGAGATDADNLGNYVPEGMRKWAGIFAANAGTPATSRAVGDQTQRLLMGLNGYAIEEATVGNIGRFGENFAGPASRLGLYRPEGSAAYRWIMQKSSDGFVLDANAPAAEIRSTAAAVRARNPSLQGDDRDVLRAFFNRPEESAKTALAEVAEGHLPPAFNPTVVQRVPSSTQLSPLTQLLLYQQPGRQSVTAYDSW